MAKAPYIKPDLAKDVYLVYEKLCRNGKPPMFKDFYKIASSEIISCPSESWCKKEFSQWNYKLQNPSELEQKWTMASLDMMENKLNIHLRSEVLPILTEYENFEFFEGDVKNIVTIRIAKWASRLVGFFLDAPPNKIMPVIMVYAIKEQWSERAGIPFDTAEFDNLLSNRDYDGIYKAFLHWSAGSDVLDRIIKRTVNNARND